MRDLRRRGARRATAAASSWWRWRGATSCASTKACARTPGCYAGLVDLSTFSVVNCFLAGGRVPDRRLAGRAHAADYTSIAIMRGDDVIFFRNGLRATATRSPTWCTRRRCTTRTGWRGRDSRACWSAAPAAPGPTSRWPGAVSKSGWARRSSRSTRRGWRCCPIGITATPRTCWRAGAARRHAAAHAAGSGRPPDAAHQPLDPPVLQRPRGARAARRCRRSSCVVVTLFNVVADWSRLTSPAAQRSAPTRCRPKPRRRGCARSRADPRPDQPDASSTSVSADGPRSQRHHRPARVLVDDAVRAVRGGAARRRPHHRGAAAPRDRRHLRRERRRRGAARRGRGRVHRSARDAGTVPERAARRGADRPRTG